MRYFGNPSTQPVRDAMSTGGSLGCIVTPAQRLTVPEGAVWCADNGVFGAGFPGVDRWWDWLSSLPYPRELCAFAVAPDVVADAVATLERSRVWLPRIRELGMPAALVAQDGLEDLDVPWSTFDVMFLGGSTEWKLGAAARDLTRQAVARGIPVHLGRVSSLMRLRYAQAIGCSSADGTYLRFGPTINLGRLQGWLRDVAEQTYLEHEGLTR